MLPTAMIPYASRTGTRRNLAKLRAANWRLLVSATGVHRNEGFQYAIDNGAWTAYQQERPFDVEAFEKVLDKLGDGADWIAVPDIVAGGLDSLRMSEQWLPRLEHYRLLLLPVQNGIEPADVEGLLGERVGIFVGGDTDWKLETLAAWGQLARKRRCHLHVARVNTARRIIRCRDHGAHSIDGTSASRYALTLPLLDNAVRQQTMFDLVGAQAQCRDCGSPELRLDPTDGALDCVDCGATEREGIHA
jgi:hypothetical protein